MAPRWRKSSVVSTRRYAVLLVLIVPLMLYVVFGSLSVKTMRSSSCQDCLGWNSMLGDERFLWYSPHSGFSNQIGELRNAFRVAAALDRILVVPPATDHHALSLGSCPKYRIVEPRRLRQAAWSHFSDLVSESRYYSMADILNISSVSPKLVRTIDLRVFALLFCGADIGRACGGPLCRQLAEQVPRSMSFEECGHILAGIGPEIQCSHCVYAVDHNCATTVWTYKHGSGASATRKLLQKLKMTKFTGPRVEVDIWEALGGETEAGKAKILSFGSLFSGEYAGTETHVDFRTPSGRDKFDQVFRGSEHFPFVDDILEAGKLFMKQSMKGNRYFCAQLRLLDGQFKNHWNKTFKDLSFRLQRVMGASKKIFLMTDLPRGKWEGTYLEKLATEYEVHELMEGDELVASTAQKVISREHGIKAGMVPLKQVQARVDGGGGHQGWGQSEVLLFVQQVVCSCAGLGFQGTTGSTITENIIQMRAAAPNCGT